MANIAECHDSWPPTSSATFLSSFSNSSRRFSNASGGYVQKIAIAKARLICLRLSSVLIEGQGFHDFIRQNFEMSDKNHLTADVSWIPNMPSKASRGH